MPIITSIIPANTIPPKIPKGRPNMKVVGWNITLKLKILLNLFLVKYFDLIEDKHPIKEYNHKIPIKTIDKLLLFS